MTAERRVVYALWDAALAVSEGAAAARDAVKEAIESLENYLKELEGQA